MFQKYSKSILASLGFVSGLFGGFDVLIKALCVAMAVDYLSGVSCAFFGKSRKTEDGKISSKQGAKGIFKKVLMLLSVLVATTLDEALGQKNMFRNATILFYLANEVFSFAENLDALGLPFPKPIVKALSKFSHESREE